MNKWIAPVLVGISVLIVGGIVYYLTRPKEPTSPSYMNTYVSNTYISLTKAESPQPLRQSPMPCEAICPGCKKIIQGNIKRDYSIPPIEDYCSIPPHEDCWYKGSDIIFNA